MRLLLFLVIFSSFSLLKTLFPAKSFDEKSLWLQNQDRATQLITKQRWIHSQQTKKLNFSTKIRLHSVCIFVKRSSLLSVPHCHSLFLIVTIFRNHIIYSIVKSLPCKQKAKHINFPTPFPGLSSFFVCTMDYFKR